MSIPSEAFMIYKEELKKERLEKERLRKDYEAETNRLSSSMNKLKERLSSQQQMMEAAYEYALELEKELDSFKKRVQVDENRNSSGYH